MRQIFALILMPVMANAAVVYDVAVRPLDQSNMALSAPVSVPVVTRYVVEDGKVRVGGPGAKSVYLFKDRTMYAIDTASRVVHVLKHATLGQAAAHYADAVRQLEDAAAAAPPDGRADAQKKAADMRAVSDRLRQPVARDYRVTTRFESVEGRACRMWEERESGAKRLELCVAAAASIPGGAEVLSGMQTLSQFRQGSNFALGVDFGLAQWWSDFTHVSGVPLLIREYKYDLVISEVTLTALSPAVPDASLWDLPDGYQVQEGPDYLQWHVR